LLVGTDLTIGNAPSGTLHFRVRAVNECGIGPVSNEVAVTVTGAGDAPAAGGATTAP
jgi:hypothetical protein